MNDSSSGPLIIALLFILRCLIPLAILFGISYLLQRWGLVTDHAELERPEKADEGDVKLKTTKPAPKPKRKKSVKKPATRAKRSRNK